MASSGLVNDCFFHSQASIHVSDYSRALQNVLQRFWEMTVIIWNSLFSICHMLRSLAHKSSSEKVTVGNVLSVCGEERGGLFCFARVHLFFPHKKTCSLTPILWSGCGGQRGMKCTTRGWQAGESYSDCLTQKLCCKDMSHVYSSFLKMLSALFYETVK